MKKEKSIYKIQFNCDPALVNNLIQSWMKSNNYTLQTKKDEQFYRGGDAMVGYTYFNYSISGQTLTVYAWLKGILGKISLEKNSINILAMTYRNSLTVLFEEIHKLSNNTENINEYNNANNYDISTSSNNLSSSNTATMQTTINNKQEPIQDNSNKFTQTFQQETKRRQEKMCEIGFWLSILGVFSSLAGVVYGVLVYIMNFYFASQGLKTRKKGKAIATIVLSIISIVIFMLQLFLALLIGY